MPGLDEDFKRFFPKKEFTLKPFQKQVISNVVDKGNTLCIMQTGGGKSVIYWMSAMECGGVTIVISPLNALIAEQVGNIRDQGYEVLEFFGGITVKKQMDNLTKFARGEITPQFIFASPEKIATDGYFEYCLKRRKSDIKLVVIDEVHCVSQWGISFRPFYKRIPNFLDNLFGTIWGAKILALTATLNQIELDDICKEFRISRENILRDEIIMRTDVDLIVRKYFKEDEKEEEFWKLLETHPGEKTLVYIYRVCGKRSVEDLCEKAQDRGIKAEYFHGDMDSDQRGDVVNKFRNGEIDVIFATNAFGMGIDIPDIRMVIHFLIPESVEQYYQEIGRASRDHNGGKAYLLYTDKNIDVKRSYFIEASFPDEQKLRDIYHKLTSGETGLTTLPYFDDEDIQQCLPYYLSVGLIEIVCKGFSGLSKLENIKDPEIQRLYDLTKPKKYIFTLRKAPGLTAPELSDMVYGALVDGNATVKNGLERWLIIDRKQAELDDQNLAVILADIKGKKKYKHELLDYFLYVLHENDQSAYLHQEIALYLGMDRHNAKRIHETADGNHVRSKSEVIICNLLYHAGIDYQYEEKLFFGEEGKHIEPDFTIRINGKTYYWEHLGMMNREDYSSRWAVKLKIYQKYFPGQLIRTYESGTISRMTESIIAQLKNGEEVGV